MQGMERYKKLPISTLRADKAIIQLLLKHVVKKQK
jgi:hypothetical protein